MYFEKLILLLGKESSHSELKGGGKEMEPGQGPVVPYAPPHWIETGFISLNHISLDRTGFQLLNPTSLVGTTGNFLTPFRGSKLQPFV
jgi:hypothetical protein